MSCLNPVASKVLDIVFGISTSISVINKMSIHDVESYFNHIEVFDFAHVLYACRFPLNFRLKYAKNVTDQYELSIAYRHFQCRDFILFSSF